MLRKISLLFFFLAIGVSVSSANSPNDSIKFRRHFELSFGQSLLFISSSRALDIRQQAAVVVPTNALLFLVQFRTDKTLRIPVFLNLATETKQFLVDGVLVNERAAPTIGTGAIFRLFDFELAKKSKLEFEAGPMLSILFNKNNNIRVAPILAGRVRLIRAEHFVMYAGVSYSLGINALGMLYGTGTIF